MKFATEQSKTLLRHANRVVAIMREEIAAHGRLHELLGRQEASVTAPASSLYVLAPHAYWTWSAHQ